MILELFTVLSHALGETFWIAAVAALVWGVLSILLSPCHLASIPLLIGFLTRHQNASRARVFVLSLVFAVGILLTIAVIGLVTASLGRLLGDVGVIGNVLVAVIFFAIGLYLLDLISLPWDGLQISPGRSSGLLAAFTLGLLFGIGLGPCTFAFMAPVLGVVFQTAQTHFAAASTLLLAFAVGHCAVIVGAGVLATRIQSYLNWSRRSKVAVVVKRTCGALVILGGVYLIWKMF